MEAISKRNACSSIKGAILIKLICLNREALISILFSTAVLVPSVGTVLSVDTGGFPGENRGTAEPPGLFDGNLRQYPKRAEAWFNDFFGLRNSMVRAHGFLKYRVLNVSSSANVVIGRDGWLFFAADRILQSRQGLIPFTDDELRSWQFKLEERRDWLRGLGISYLFIVAPEKSTIYPEQLPHHLQATAGVSRLDQLMSWMAAHSTVQLLDLREPLRAAKAKAPILRKSRRLQLGGRVCRVLRNRSMAWEGVSGSRASCEGQPNSRRA